MPNVIGADVSFYQDNPGTTRGIDFVKMKQTAGFAIIRAGQNVWPDSDFNENWRNAKAAGIPRGSYWFYDSRSEPKQQANLWYSLFAGDLGELPLFADLEESYGGSYAGWKNWKIFIERIKTLANKKEIGIYTAYYYWLNNAPSASADPVNLNYFKQYPLWIANYGVTKPSVPKPWGESEWVLWQYTDKGDGNLYGVESLGIDLNYFNGDAQAFINRFKLQTPAPPPGDGEKPTWYKVTTSALNVREGPSTTFNAIGTLKRDEVVESLAESPDGGWVRIKRASDGLTGWSSLQFLIPASPPDPPPDDVPTETWYKVVAAALNVREGPGINFKFIGSLKRDEVVKGLATSADGGWAQILRTSDGLTGWSSKQYLVNTSAPSTPPPAEEQIPRYQATASALNVREGPDTNQKSIGYLQKNDVVAGLDVTTDGKWRKIERFDGLAGWVSNQYLVSLGMNPAEITQRLFTGVTYYRKVRMSPRRMVSHVLVIDVFTVGIQFLVTPPDRTTFPELCTSTTSQFLAKNKQQIAINGDGFYYLDPSAYDPQNYCPDGGDPVRLIGYAASHGKIYSEKAQGRPILYINQNNIISFDSPKGKVFNAITGDRMLASKGKQVSGLESTSLNPRSAIGVNQNGRWLTLAVIDGREFSQGATFPELAELLLSHGVYTGMSLDGGGSSTMAIEGVNGQPRVLSTLIDEGIPGRERAVANHLGISFKK